MDENTRTATRQSQRTRTVPTASEDRAVIAEHDRAEARRQATEDARAQWLGYQSEADFTHRAAAQLDRHPTLPRHLVRHARFIYLGADK